MSQRIMQQARENGLGHTLRAGYCEAYWRYREKNLGLRTRGIIPASDLSPNPDSQEYKPIPFALMDSAFRRLDIRPDRDVFLDYGSGMGRALIFAATHPFRRVIGVEINAELCRIAEENVRKCAWLRCKKVDVFSQDAAQFVVPDDVTHIWLCNPFTGATLATVLNAVRQSLDRCPRSCTFIYLRPQAYPDSLATVPWLHKVCDLPTAWWTWVKFCIYQAG